jgi:hypothetical protein
MGSFSGKIQQIPKTGFYIQNKNKDNNGRHQKGIFRKFNILPLARKYLLSVLSQVVEKNGKIVNKFRCAQNRYKSQI